MQEEATVSLFRSRFEAAGGRVHFSDDLERVPVLLKELLQKAPQGIHVSEGIRSTMGRLMANQGIRLGVEKSASDYRVPGTGITEAEFGIASTGSLVEIAYDEGTRLASASTRVHIALLDRSSILDDLQQLAGIVREKLAGEKKPVITLINGPSRTSDIELKDVVGVHGPDEVHVIIYRRSGDDES